MRSWACYCKKRCVQAHCYFEELKIDCAIDNSNLVQSQWRNIIIYCYLKSALVENPPLGRSTMRVHFAYYTKGRVTARPGLRIQRTLGKMSCWAPTHMCTMKVLIYSVLFIGNTSILYRIYTDFSLCALKFCRLNKNLP